jgi:hypothetical protein
MAKKLLKKQIGGTSSTSVKSADGKYKTVTKQNSEGDYESKVKRTLKGFITGSPRVSKIQKGYVTAVAPEGPKISSPNVKSRVKRETPTFKKGGTIKAKKK